MRRRRSAAAAFSTHVPIGLQRLLWGLRDVHFEHTFREGRLHVVRVGFQRKIEPPLERLLETFAEPECLLRLLLGLRLPLALDRQRVFRHLDPELLLLEAGNLELDHEVVVGLVEIGGRDGERPEADVVKDPALCRSTSSPRGIHLVRVVMPLLFADETHGPTRPHRAADLPGNYGAEVRCCAG